MQGFRTQAFPNRLTLAYRYANRYTSFINTDKLYIYLFKKGAPILGQNVEALGDSLLCLALGLALIIRDQCT